MAADPGLHRSGFSEPRKTGAADRSPEASLKLGRTEEPAAAVLGEDSPGSSAVRWRKLGRRSHNHVMVKLGKRIPGRWSQCELMMKLAGGLVWLVNCAEEASRHCGENR